MTEHLTYKDGSSEISRDVVIGDNIFNKGKLQSAMTKELAYESIYFDSNNRMVGRQGNIEKINAPVQIYTSPWKKYQLSFIQAFNASSTQASYSTSPGKLVEPDNDVAGNGNELNYWDYSIPGVSFHYGSIVDQNTIAILGEGRFFNEGWWNNPFVPNLI